MKKVLMTIITMAFMAFSTSAIAGTAAGSMNVGVTAAAACSVTANPLSFPDYNGSSSVNVSSVVGFNCSAPVVATMSMDSGQHAMGSQRYMVNAGATSGLAYNLYNTSSGAPFGDGTTGATHTFTSSTGANTAVTGTIAGGQGFLEGAHLDIVSVTIAY